VHDHKKPALPSVFVLLLLLPSARNLPPAARRPSEKLKNEVRCNQPISETVLRTLSLGVLLVCLGCPAWFPVQQAPERTAAPEEVRST